MPGGSKRYIRTRQRELCQCGTPLKEHQLWYCSDQCRLEYAYLNPGDKSSNTNSVQEPYIGNRRQVKDFEETIKRRKKELDTPELEVIRSQTPEDESPESEKRLRAIVCPNPAILLPPLS